MRPRKIWRQFFTLWSIFKGEGCLIVTYNWPIDAYTLIFVWSSDVLQPILNVFKFAAISETTFCRSAPPLLSKNGTTSAPTRSFPPRSTRVTSRTRPSGPPSTKPGRPSPRPLRREKPSTASSSPLKNPSKIPSLSSAPVSLLEFEMKHRYLFELGNSKFSIIYSGGFWSPTVT